MSVKSKKRADRPKAALDAAFDAYLDWLGRCDALQSAYDNWVRARRADTARAYSAYKRALDREAGAADVYRAALTAVDRLARADLRRQRADTWEKAVCAQ